MTMIKRVARAIRDERDRQDGDDGAVAYAAIAAMREPTKRMLAAARFLGEPSYRAVWQAMIDGVLKEKPRRSRSIRFASRQQVRKL
jgi:hypothetical protein